MNNLFLNNNVDGTIFINDYAFVMESVSVDNSSTNYDIVSTKILGGTEVNTRGDWIGRSFSFTTYLRFNEEDYHDKYDEVLNELSSKPCEIISQDFGGTFIAKVDFKKNPIVSNPNGMELNVSIKELGNYSEPSLTTSSENRFKIGEK